MLKWNKLIEQRLIKSNFVIRCHLNCQSSRICRRHASKLQADRVASTCESGSAEALDVPQTIMITVHRLFPFGSTAAGTHQSTVAQRT